MLPRVSPIFYTTYVEAWLRDGSEIVQDPVALTGLDTLITALYVKIGDNLRGAAGWDGRHGCPMPG